MKNVIPLKILNGEGCHYLSVKNLSELLFIFICLEQKTLFNHIKRYEKKDFWGVAMSSEDTKKLDKTLLLFVLILDLQ